MKPQMVFHMNSIINIYVVDPIHMYSGITSGRVLDGELLWVPMQRLVDWREISMKQSVGKCKQINF